MNATILDGLVEGLSELEYHRHSALSSTGARTLLRSAAKFDYDRTHPIHKDAFDVGSAVHTKVLGKGWDVVVVDAEDWRTKAAKEARDEARESGRIPLLRRDFEVVEAMAESVLNNPLARRIFDAGGYREASLFTTDNDTGVAMRARPDVLQDDRFVDLKTAQSAASDDFGRDAAKYGYQVQEWYYRRAAEPYIDTMAADFLFVVVEKSAPYLVNVIELDAEFGQIGRAQVDRALRLYAECAATGQWPGYENPSEPDKPNLVGPPAYLAYREGMEF